LIWSTGAASGNMLDLAETAVLTNIGGVSLGDINTISCLFILSHRQRVHR
jgi:hypothetical protein